jgi:hypothetical protein
VFTAGAPSGDAATGPPSATFGLLTSPRALEPAGPLRVLAAFETAFRDVRISVGGPDGPLAPLRVRRGGGPPFWQAAEFRLPGPGRYTLVVTRDGRKEGEESLTVPSPALPEEKGRGVWESTSGWTRGWEDLYSAWLDALFADADERASWGALHEVMREPGRNLLFDHLGLGEDNGSGPNAI